MEQEEEEIECNTNNITCDTSFEPPITMNEQKEDSKFPFERWPVSVILEEIFENVKGCTIQSDKQVDKIIDSEEYVDLRNWLRNDSSEQIDAISDSEKLAVDGSDQKAIQV